MGRRDGQVRTCSAEGARKFKSKWGGGVGGGALFEYHLVLARKPSDQVLQNEAEQGQAGCKRSGIGVTRSCSSWAAEYGRRARSYGKCCSEPEGRRVVLGTLELARPTTDLGIAAAQRGTLRQCTRRQERRQANFVRVRTRLTHPRGRDEESCACLKNWATAFGDRLVGDRKAGPQVGQELGELAAVEKLVGEIERSANQPKTRRFEVERTLRAGGRGLDDGSSSLRRGERRTRHLLFHDQSPAGAEHTKVEPTKNVSVKWWLRIHYLIQVLQQV